MSNRILCEVVKILGDTSTLSGEEIDARGHRILNYLKDIKEDTGKIVEEGSGNADFTPEDKAKLDSIETNAQVNTIEIIQINGVPVAINTKTVNLDLSGYALKTDVTGAMKIKGSVNTYAELPADPELGDAYAILTADSEHDISPDEIVCYTSTGWVDMGGAVDLSLYLTKTDASDTYALKSHTHTVSQVTDIETWLTGKGYETSSHASSTYLSKTDAGNTYLTQDDASSTYLTQDDADTTYLSKSDADTTYQTKSDTTTNYLKKTDAGNTYLSKTDASNTYQTKSDTTTNYLKKTDASSTYLTQANASSTYLTKSTASSTYLTKTDASNIYQAKGTYAKGLSVTTSNYTTTASGKVTRTISGYASGCVLLVYLNGLKMIPTTEYTISSSGSFSTVNSINSGQTFEFVVIKVTT